MSTLKPKFFITGGTGFVGRRLVDVLRRECNADVTVLAHRTSPGALALAAKGVTFDFTPITDAEGLTKAIKGHDAIFHLAYGRYGTAADMRKTTIDGTQAVVDAALAANVKRFINVSTAAVYNGAPDGLVDETAPRRKWGWDYSDEKLAAEDCVRAATEKRGLEGSVFQIVGVYGPGGETFVISPLRNMARGTVVLPNYGEGIANMSYVDDVVQALILGLKDEAIGETFLIKGPGKVTRMEAYRKLEAMMKVDGVVGMATEDVRKAANDSADWAALFKLPSEAFRAIRRSTEFKDTVRRTPLANAGKYVYRKYLTDTGKSGSVVLKTSHPPKARELIFPPSILIDQLAAKVEFSTAKAERLLGYNARVSLDDGMARTEEWARWSGYLDV